MSHIPQFIRRTAFCGILLTCAQAAVLWAGSTPYKPCNPPFPCGPNAANWGFFETRWREWPTQYRPEEKNPRAVGATVVPTPAGQEQVPLPKASLLPGKPEAPTGPDGVGPGLPLQPKAPTKQEEDDFPGLPKPAPAVPEAKEPEGLPGLNLDEPARPRPAKPSTEEATPPAPGELRPVRPSREGDSQPTNPELPNASDGREQRPPLLNAPKVGAERRRPVAPVPLQADWAGALHPESLALVKAQPAGYQSASEPSVSEPRPALGGYCPVKLREHESWIPGDPRFTGQYKGQKFLFAGAVELEKFLANPDRYAPAFSGNDPVLAAEEHHDLPGKLDHTAVYNGRLYLFSGPATLARFRSNPDRYGR